MVELEKIEKLSRKIPIEEVLKEHDWKEFEETVAEIFRRNEFAVKRNFRFKTRKRHEIDVLSVKRDSVICVDCKRWLGGRYKKSQLKKSVKEQEKRVRLLKNFLKRNPIAMQMLKIGPGCKFYPLMVTLMEEEIKKEGNTFIVPIFKLNSFLLEYF
jgi:Holliday junction resolvase-like predicted endonuclease